MTAPPNTVTSRVVLLGDPRLRRLAQPVDDIRHPQSQAEFQTLHQTLNAFRATHGFGRAISAPQIGIAKRFIAVNLGPDVFTMVNPAIEYRSTETFSLWDDCMSFPELLVKVSRHVSISVRFEDQYGGSQILERLDRSASELFQHEIDHLNGVLAVDRAMDRDSLVMRSVFEAERTNFESMVG